MGKAAPARRVALSILGEARRRDAHARELLRSDDRMRALDARDRALATRLVLGVVGSRGLLDALIDNHLKRGAKLEPKVRDALRLATYELAFLSTPGPVAVSEGVELVRACRPKAAPLANAVLRKVADVDVKRRQAALTHVQAGSSELQDLYLVSGYPTWLLDCIVADRGPEAARAVALAATGAAPVWVAVNRCRLDDEAALSAMREAGLDPVAVPDMDGTYRLNEPAGLAQTGLVEASDLIVSDLAAQRVAALVDVGPSGKVLEVGQGRGTKTLLIESRAERGAGPVCLCGVEAEPFKVGIVERRVRASGLGDYVSCHALDGRELSAAEGLPEALGGRFQTVLVDAPCTGTGTLRRHPEISWRLGPSDVRELAALQLALLKAAAVKVEAGGTLLYATCSVLRQEDEDVVAAFLGSPEGAPFAQEGEALLSLPCLDGPDGHFCARLTRRG